MAHDHHHHNTGKNISIAFFLNLGFTILEIIGGFFTNSVAILSDALHDLGDSISLGLAWYLEKKSKKGRTSQFSFGYRRFSLLGALINSIILIAGSIWIISEAVQRIMSPEMPMAEGMAVIAVGGIIINGLAVYKLKGGSSLNESVVRWHLLEDVLGWIAVFIVSIVLLFVEIPVLDPILSIAITLYVLFNVLKRLRKTAHIFLQGVPENINIEAIKDKIQDVEKVQSLHHTHIWSLDGEHHVFTTHVKLQKISVYHEIMDVRQKIRDQLKEYDFTHLTIEIELDEETCELEHDK